MGKLLRGQVAELTLYARHLAWLHATPKPPEGTKRAGKPNEKTLSRLEQFKAEKITPPMPPCASTRVIERWIEIGMIQGGGMAPTALPWSEIAAFREATGLPLDTWTARTIRTMSVAYIGESRRADCETCPPPWNPGVTQRERDIQDQRLRAVLG